MPAGPLAPEPGGGFRVPVQAPKGIADKATAGFAFLIFQTVIVRLVRFGGQFLLAWILLPRDFGLYALAVTLHQFISVLKNAGLRDILVYRERKLYLWVNPAAWMSLSLGLAGGLVMWLVAPAMASMFDRPELANLVYVLAITTVFQSLGQVPIAVLHARMKFVTSGVIEGVNNVALMALTIVFAYMGMGAMSFVVPMLIVAIGRTAYLWWLVRPPVKVSPQFRRWRFLLGDSTRLIGADVARTAIIQCPNLILGKVFASGAVVGYYFYGYQLSIQSLWLFARNLDTVLLPSLSKLQADPGRHARAFFRAAKTLATVGFPISFLQAAMAESGVRLLLSDNFFPVIPYMVVLSIGMAGQLLVQPSMAMLRSQGRFAYFVTITWIQAVVFLGLVLLAALFGSEAVDWTLKTLGGMLNISGVHVRTDSGPLMVALTVAAVSAFFGLVYTYAALRDLENRFWMTLRVVGWPTALSAIATGAGWLTGTLVPGDDRLSHLFRLIVIGTVAFAIYIPTIRVVDPEVSKEVVTRFGGVVSKLMKKLKKRKAASA